jgi:hypothetical protein
MVRGRRNFEIWIGRAGPSSAESEGEGEMTEVAKLRKRGLRLSFVACALFKRKDYRINGKPIRYSFVDQHGERFASNVAELLELVQCAELLARRR